MEPRRRIIRVACVQMSAGRRLESNLEESFHWVQRASRKKVQFTAFPENFLFRGSFREFSKIARIAERKIIPEFCRLAQKLSMELLLGSVILPSKVPGKFRNVSIHIASSGKILSQYQKMHLFDIGLPGVRVRESDHFLRGKKAVSTKACGVLAGLSICYDLRFPELYRKISQKGCRLLFVPSNFTKKTGEAHWHSLLRARAIENQAFVLAPGQCGVHPESGIRSYGHSMILDPWGKVLAEADGSSSGLISADLDLHEQEALRRNFPVLSHRFLK